MIGIEPDAVTDPASAARAAGLRYVHDDAPGIRRRRAGRGFHYVDTDGTPLRDLEELARIRALAIPPAWRDVWICPSPRGHIQATGRDSRGRKQYRYHGAWRELRDEVKYERMAAFGEALPAIRARLEADLSGHTLTRERVLAAVVRLLDETYVRVGNEEYARSNRSYGLTTLRSRHVDVDGASVRIRFRGKSGVRHTLDLRDRRLARVVKRCQDLPGEELFQYVDADGEPRAIDSADVNDYLRDITGQEFTAKHFRTWAGSVLVCAALTERERPGSDAEAKHAVTAAVEGVAARLRNTPAVCRKCYVHPLVVESYVDGMLPARVAAGGRLTTALRRRLSQDEQALLRLLRSAEYEVERRSA